MHSVYTVGDHAAWFGMSDVCFRWEFQVQTSVVFFVRTLLRTGELGALLLWATCTIHPYQAYPGSLVQLTWVTTPAGTRYYKSIDYRTPADLCQNRREYQTRKMSTV